MTSIMRAYRTAGALLLASGSFIFARFEFLFFAPGETWRVASVRTGILSCGTGEPWYTVTTGFSAWHASSNVYLGGRFSPCKLLYGEYQLTLETLCLAGGGHGGIDLNTRDTTGGHFFLFSPCSNNPRNSLRFQVPRITMISQGAHASS